MPKCKCEHWQICPMCAPHFFDADGKRKPPELTPLQECRAALDALRQAAKEAAEHLRHEAAELKRAHTISGEWDGTEPEAMAECKRLIALADRLQANAMLHSINGSACTSSEKVWRQARSALKRAARWKAVFESHPSNTSAVNLLEPGKLAFNICGIAMKDPGGAATWMTFSSPCNIDPRHAARVHWRNVCQVSLATIALHAGWKLRSLARQRLLDPLRLVPSVFGLSHGHSFK